LFENTKYNDTRNISLNNQEGQKDHIVFRIDWFFRMLLNMESEVVFEL